MQGSLEKEFQQVGGMARPAGVPGGLGSSNLASDYYGKSLVKGTDRGLHALATASPYAERAEPGWAPKEPTVRPTWADKGAGVVSAGCIDNTYMPAPLKNKWGKCREMTRNEVVVLPHKQATDLLAVTLGTQMPLPKQEVHELANIREKYSAPIPLYHQIDPLRSEGGFVRTPNIIPGALPPPVSPLHTAPPVTMIPDDWKQRKLQCAPLTMPPSPLCHSTVLAVRAGPVSASAAHALARARTPRPHPARRLARPPARQVRAGAEGLGSHPGAEEGLRRRHPWRRGGPRLLLAQARGLAGRPFPHPCQALSRVERI